MGIPLTLRKVFLKEKVLVKLWQSRLKKNGKPRPRASVGLGLAMCLAAKYIYGAAGDLGRPCGVLGKLTSFRTLDAEICAHFISYDHLKGDESLRI